MTKEMAMVLLGVYANNYDKTISLTHDSSEMILEAGSHQFWIKAECYWHAAADYDIGRMLFIQADSFYCAIYLKKEYHEDRINILISGHYHDGMAIDHVEFKLIPGCTQEQADDDLLLLVLSA